MPEDLDAEIAATLKEIEDESGQPEQAEDPEPEEGKKEDGKPESEETQGDESPKGDKKPDEAPKPEPKVIPAWKLKIAEKRAAKANAPEPEKKDEEPPAREPAHSKDDIESLAAEIGADPDAVRKLDAYFAKKYATPQLPPEMQELLKDYPALKQLREQHDSQQAELGFASEFEESVRPLVEAEYPGATPELLKSISADLRKKVEEDPRLLYTPLKTIYKGEDDFRGLAPRKKSADGGRPTSGSRSDKVIDFEEVSDEDIRNFTDEQMEQYSAYQMEKERNRK